MFGGKQERRGTDASEEVPVAVAYLFGLSRIDVRAMRQQRPRQVKTANVAGRFGRCQSLPLIGTSCVRKLVQTRPSLVGGVRVRTLFQQIDRELEMGVGDGERQGRAPDLRACLYETESHWLLGLGHGLNRVVDVGAQAEQRANRVGPPSPHREHQRGEPPVGTDVDIRALLDQEPQRQRVVLGGRPHHRRLAAPRFYRVEGAVLDGQTKREGWTPLRIASGVLYTGTVKRADHTAELLLQLMRERGLSVDAEAVNSVAEPPPRRR